MTFGQMLRFQNMVRCGVYDPPELRGTEGNETMKIADRARDLLVFLTV